MLKTAEEVAREMIDDTGALRVHGCSETVAFDVNGACDIEEVRSTMARIVELIREECAAAERERLAAHAVRPAEEVAKEMVYTTPGIDPYPIMVCLGDDDDFVPLEHQDDRGDVARITNDARGILTRLLTRERAAAYAQGKADGALEERELRAADRLAAVEQYIKDATEKADSRISAAFPAPKR